jgi:general stress protein YciG
VIFLSMREETRKGKMTVAEAGRKGGEKTAQTHGREFDEEIGRKGGAKVSQERGPEFYSEIGSKGGSERAKQHEGTSEAIGKTSLEEAGHRGGQRVRKLIQVGKEHEEELKSLF